MIKVIALTLSFPAREKPIIHWCADPEDARRYLQSVPNATLVKAEVVAFAASTLADWRRLAARLLNGELPCVTGHCPINL